jgi:glycine/D-amino acid oxidase-like deaminating enzyme
MSDEMEFLIVGQGLAGTTLAWELIRRGREVMIVDAEETVTSSKIAAGLVTPITGQRMALSWRIHETLHTAREFYGRIEAELAAPLLHERPILRLFRDAAEAARWGRRRADTAFAPFIERPFVDVGEFGGFEIRGGGYLDCARYLGDSREVFKKRGMYEARYLDPVEAATHPARWVIFCQGFAAARNPFFGWVPWKAAKGEILTVRIPALAGENRILTAGQWLAPVGSEFFRTGSTYEWHQLNSNPTAEARTLLESGLRRLTPHPFEIADHRAAVRPIINESKALAGIHPAREKLAFFNGLGSKGSLHAPFVAQMLAAHLVDGTPLDETCDLRRN